MLTVSPGVARLRFLIAALVALAVSGMLLVAVYVALFERFHPELAGITHKDAAPIRLSGKTFIPLVYGAGGLEGDTRLITALNQGEAFLETEVNFAPGEHAFLRISGQGLHPGLNIMIVWRTREQPNMNQGLQLQGLHDGDNLLNLKPLVPPNGTIDRLGLFFTGDMRGQPLRLEGVSFEPFAASNALGMVWQEWRAFRGWNHSSINAIWGTTPGAQAYPPPITFAVWAALACALLYLAPRSVVGSRAAAAATVILLCWICLDLLWRGELAVQLEETRLDFAGKTIREKQLADGDGALYSYTRELSRLMQPNPDSRLFILKEPPYGHDLIRLKTHYFLLPRRIYNYGSVPPPNSLHPGDYLLLLGPQADKTFNTASSDLRLAQESLKATLLHSSVYGELFRVCQPQGASNAAPIPAGPPCP